MLQLQLTAGRYEVLTNKFPMYARHILLVAKDPVPQQLNSVHLDAVAEFMRACSFTGFFNSWKGGASVNHFHVQFMDEIPAVAQLPLVAGPLVQGERCQMPEGYAGTCYVFDAVSQATTVDLAVRAMQADNQPHNIVFTPPINGRPSFVYIFPNPQSFPSRTFELYPGHLGGSEYSGTFTLFSQTDFDSFSPEDADELTRINTARLPVALLRRANTLSNSFMTVPLSAL